MLTALRFALAALIVSVVLVAPAHAAKKKTTLLWATVNVCDTAKSPDMLGVRGSMPGTGDKGEMFMRFRVQYYDIEKKAWRAVKDDDADSGFLSAGSSRFKVRQTGATFHFPPPAGGRFRLRGVVDFEWRAKGKVIKRARRITEKGRQSVSGADPAGYSAAECVIR